MSINKALGRISRQRRALLFISNGCLQTSGKIKGGELPGRVISQRRIEVARLLITNIGVEGIALIEDDLLTLSIGPDTQLPRQFGGRGRRARSIVDQGFPGLGT
jgi:hypothetical protein